VAEDAMQQDAMQVEDAVHDAVKAEDGSEGRKGKGLEAMGNSHGINPDKGEER
jgi:hypothetical protein